MKILELDNGNLKNIQTKNFRLYSKFNNWTGKIENVYEKKCTRIIVKYYISLFKFSVNSVIKKFFSIFIIN